VIALPLYPEMNETAIEEVVGAIREFCDRRDGVGG
jgi:dTDP-4-amino-4,6-dideoxygalactose transaminase